MTETDSRGKLRPREIPNGPGTERENESVARTRGSRVKRGHAIAFLRDFPLLPMSLAYNASNFPSRKMSCRCSTSRGKTVRLACLAPRRLCSENGQLAIGRWANDATGSL